VQRHAGRAAQRRALAGVIQRFDADDNFRIFLNLIGNAERENEERAAARAKLNTLKTARSWNRKRQTAIDAMDYGSVPADYEKLGQKINKQVGWGLNSTYRRRYYNNENCLPNAGQYHEYGPSGLPAGNNRAITPGYKVTPRANTYIYFTYGGTHADDNPKAAAKPWYYWDQTRWWKYNANANGRGYYEYDALKMDNEVLLTRAEAKKLTDAGENVPPNCIGPV
jgi:hypothetical protein